MMVLLDFYEISTNFYLSILRRLGKERKEQ